MKRSNSPPLPDVPLRPACERDGTWSTLPASGALIRVDGKPYIVDLQHDAQARASSLWRLLERKKDDTRRG